jgi:hypothetical protein
MIREYGRNPARWRGDLIIRVANESPRYADIQDLWQERDVFSRIDAALLRLAGVSDNPEARRFFYFEVPRGHNKTTGLAWCSLWLLLFARQRTRSLALAGDKDQAKLLLDALVETIATNEWMARRVEIHDYKVTARDTGSRLVVLSSDAATSYGERPTGIVVVDWSTTGAAICLIPFSAPCPSRRTRFSAS